MQTLLSKKTHPYHLFQNASTRYAEGYEAVQCDIKTILDSPRGQLLGKPNFGSYLFESLGEMSDQQLIQKASYEVKRAIEEAYVNVSVEPEISIEESIVHIKIHIVFNSYSEDMDFVYDYERSTNGN